MLGFITFSWPRLTPRSTSDLCDQKGWHRFEEIHWRPGGLWGSKFKMSLLISPRLSATWAAYSMHTGCKGSTAQSVLAGDRIGCESSFKGFVQVFLKYENQVSNNVS